MHKRSSGRQEAVLHCRHSVPRPSWALREDEGGERRPTRGLEVKGRAKGGRRRTNKRTNDHGRRRAPPGSLTRARGSRCRCCTSERCRSTPRRRRSTRSAPRGTSRCRRRPRSIPPRACASSSWRAPAAAPRPPSGDAATQSAFDLVESTVQVKQWSSLVTWIHSSASRASHAALAAAPFAFPAAPAPAATASGSRLLRMTAESPTWA